MFGHLPVRKIFWAASIAVIGGVEVAASVWPHARFAYFVIVPVMALGIADIMQTKQAIKRNFPLIGHGRYLMEMIRPEINQYFIESDIDGRPFDRQKRSNIYQRAKRELNTNPFGTQKNVYEVGYEWINHSLAPVAVTEKDPRVLIGGSECKQPYSASIFNISAMSYGSLSKNAILALNKGAKAGNFLHNTGEGGLSPYHLEHGGDLTWQIGTGYFSCRTPEGHFSPERFAEKAAIESVKMIEVKLSQGAKPGHGGILPKEKITPEIAQIRGVVMDRDVVSPPAHTAFSSPRGLLEFISQLRDLSNGKPVGFKLCLGAPHEFLAICKAMLETGILPDFITVDGGEGGTGAAPLEFSDSVGTPLEDGMVFVHNALRGIGLRDKIRLIVSGKITTGFHIAQKLALGADLCNSARGMMFALGCIQALQCHANTCPTGVATQNPELVQGLVVEHKWKRVRNFHDATVHNFIEILGAAGLSQPSDLKPWHILRRISATEVRSLDEVYHYIQSGALLTSPIPAAFERDWERANPDSFLPRSVSLIL
jgi:glutamate synthase domain-containing protein 2